MAAVLLLEGRCMKEGWGRVPREDRIEVTDASLPLLSEDMWSEGASPPTQQPRSPTMV